MSVKIFAEQMKGTIKEIKETGIENLSCDNIINYLDEVINSPEPVPTAFDIEKYKAELQSWVEHNKQEHISNVEMFRSIISAGQQAIKSSFLLNGGASVALLAFIAHLAQFDKEKIPIFGCLILPFAFGVLAITITSGCTYLSQWLYASPKLTARKWGFAINIFCIVLGITSYGLFLWGLFSTYYQFKHYQ